MGIFIKAYYGWRMDPTLTWGQGKVTALHVPDCPGYDSLVKTGTSVVALTADYPNQFDNTWTFFARSAEAKQAMIDRGFTDVRDVEALMAEEGGTLAFYINYNVYFLIGISGSNVEITFRNEAVSPSFIQSYRDINIGIPGPGGAEGTGLLFPAVRNLRPNGVQFDYTLMGYGTDIAEKFWAYSSDSVNDPYGGIGPSLPASNIPTWDWSSDSNPDDGLPQFSAISSGMISLWSMTQGSLNSLAQFLWSGAFDIDTFRKITNDPMGAILGLSVFPFSVGGSAGTVIVGNQDSGVPAAKVTSQFLNVNCGAVTIPTFTGSYLDYEPYTTAQIYLPFSGWHPLNIDDCMGKTVSVYYRIDLLSGACNIDVKINGDIYYNYSGQCSMQIPITSINYNQMLSSAVSIAVTAAGAAAALSAGATAPLAVSALGSIANNVMTAKPNVQRSGSISGAAGFMANQTPAIYISAPNLCWPEDQAAFEGYPSFISTVLTAQTGYTQVYSIHLDNVPATAAEKDEIQRILKEGVIL